MRCYANCIIYKKNTHLLLGSRLQPDKKNQNIILADGVAFVRTPRSHLRPAQHASHPSPRRAPGQGEGRGVPQHAPRRPDRAPRRILEGREGGGGSLRPGMGWWDDNGGTNPDRCRPARLSVRWQRTGPTRKRAPSPLHTGEGGREGRDNEGGERRGPGVTAASRRSPATLWALSRRRASVVGGRDSRATTPWVRARRRRIRLGVQTWHSFVSLVSALVLALGMGPLGLPLNCGQGGGRPTDPSIL